MGKLLITCGISGLAVRHVNPSFFKFARVEIDKARACFLGQFPCSTLIDWRPMEDNVMLALTLLPIFGLTVGPTVEFINAISFIWGA